MADESDPEREALHDAIAANSGHVQEASGGAVLTGWVVVSEWIDKDGERYLAHCRAASTSPWTGRGMLHDVLHRSGEDDLQAPGRLSVGEPQPSGPSTVVRCSGSSTSGSRQSTHHHPPERSACPRSTA